MDTTTLVNDAISLVALTEMEIVLGIDNIVFISVVSGQLPEAERNSARQIGLLAAMGTRILLLLTLTWIMQLTQPIFSLSQLSLPVDWIDWLRHEHQKELNEFSWRELILLLGGLFLIRSSVVEIHNKIEGTHGDHGEAKKVTFAGVIFQIAVLDIIFSLDSVVTAVGMAESIWVMITAVV